jgi:hypothetical protein
MSRAAISTPSSKVRREDRVLHRASEPLADRLLSQSLLRSRQTVVAAEEWAEELQVISVIEVRVGRGVPPDWLSRS